MIFITSKQAKELRESGILERDKKNGRFLDLPHTGYGKKSKHKKYYTTRIIYQKLIRKQIK